MNNQRKDQCPICGSILLNESIVPRACPACYNAMNINNSLISFDLDKAKKVRIANNNQGKVILRQKMKRLRKLINEKSSIDKICRILKSLDTSVLLESDCSLLLTQLKPYTHPPAEPVVEQICSFTNSLQKRLEEIKKEKTRGSDNDISRKEP